MSAPEKGAGETCQWFALCVNPATRTEPHPVLGEVPICDRCKAKIDALASKVRP